MDGWTDGQMDDGWMDRGMDGQMDDGCRWMDRWMDEQAIYTRDTNQEADVPEINSTIVQLSSQMFQLSTAMSPPTTQG